MRATGTPAVFLERRPGGGTGAARRRAVAHARASPRFLESAPCRSCNCIDGHEHIGKHNAGGREHHGRPAVSRADPASGIPAPGGSGGTPRCVGCSCASLGPRRCAQSEVAPGPRRIRGRAFRDSRHCRSGAVARSRGRQGLLRRDSRLPGGVPGLAATQHHPAPHGGADRRSRRAWADPAPLRGRASADRQGAVAIRTSPREHGGSGPRGGIRARSMAGVQARRIRGA